MLKDITKWRLEGAKERRRLSPQRRAKLARKLRSIVRPFPGSKYQGVST